MTEAVSQKSILEKRATELSTMPPQQLLGYIAAILEVLLERQAHTSSEILGLLLTGVVVSGSVSIDNTVSVKVENISPVHVEVDNKVAVEVNDGIPLQVEVTNTPLEVTSD